MDTQYLTLLNTVVTAVEALRVQGVGVNVLVTQVNVTMPDQHTVAINRDPALNVWEVKVS